MNLVLVARSCAALERVRDELQASGIQAVALAADLADRASLGPLVSASEAAFGAVDVLVNNAGVWQPTDYATTDPDRIEGVIDLNLRAPMLLSRLVLPGMIARGSGHIVNVSSVGGLGGAPYAESYTATKHALLGFTRSLRLSMRSERRPVGVSAICPGFVWGSGLFQDAMDRTGVSGPERIGSCTPEQVADAVVDAILRDRPEVVVNSVPVRPLVLMQTLFPSWIEKISIASGIFRACKEIAERDRLLAHERAGDARASLVTPTWSALRRDADVIGP
jgi:short-subunit dehydrogenase